MLCLGRDDLEELVPRLGAPRTDIPGPTSDVSLLASFKRDLRLDFCRGIVGFSLCFQLHTSHWAEVFTLNMQLL